jgi:hypothetical protein
MSTYTKYDKEFGHCYSLLYEGYKLKQDLNNIDYELSYKYNYNLFLKEQ